MLAMASVTVGRDCSDSAMLLLATKLDLRGSITRHCKMDSSLIVTSLFGKTEICAGRGLSVGPITPPAGVTLNMLHTDCGQPAVGTNDNLKHTHSHLIPSTKTHLYYKLACFVFSSLSGHAPLYLTDNIHLVSESHRRWLRSSTDRLCAVPRTHNTFSDRSFAVAGPRVWNSLPAHLRQVARRGHYIQQFQA